LQKTKINVRKLVLAVFCIVSAVFITLGAFYLPCQARAQVAGEQTFGPTVHAPALPSSIQPTNDVVDIGVWLVNIFDYQYTTGGYTMDMYSYFFWSNPNITTIDWHFANGYAITPTSITMVANGTSNGAKYEIYRATARLSTPPDASNFPFDEINLTISIDMLTHGNNVSLNWLTNETGIDPQFHTPGWTTSSFQLNSTLHPYPLGVNVPRAEMVVTQHRQREATSFAPFFPPIFFSIVSAVSFLFSLKEMGSVGLRIGLNTSMLVTTLLFSFSVSNGIPPASNIVLYSIFLLSVLIFMVCNLIVTIIGVVGWVKYKNEKRTTLANKLGFLISIIVPVALFLFLYFVR
jgi:hypothetical protein